MGVCQGGAWLVTRPFGWCGGRRGGWQPYARTAVQVEEYVPAIRGSPAGHRSVLSWVTTCNWPQAT